MDVTALSAFIAVARRESFSMAADDLYLTQPAVSKRVAALEAELGIKLFHRVARQISLTEAGQQLLPKAVEMLEHADDMKRYAANLSTDISGTLSVAIAHHIGLHRMPPVLSAFNRQHPQVALDIHFEDSDQALHKVEQGEIEFAVITLPETLPERLWMKTVWVDPLSVVVGKGHPLLANKHTTLAQLREYPCVLPETATETFQIVANAVERDQQRLIVQMCTNNLESLKMLVSAGIGWSALPDSMLDTTVHKLDTDLKLSRNLGMVFHSKRSLSNAAQALVELIQHSAN